ncbi:MAG TPA: hypothetical protein VJ831_14010 [Jatrophihabitantaceae bacterium]|nr:hypothetical protein [Jatrophihabitantaceae bacterium]
MASWGRVWLAMVATLAIGVAVAAPAGAVAGGDPPGNNGTVKIDGRPFDDAPDNEPHPGCVFQVDFYGFDAGNLDADVTFEAVAPTDGDVLLTDTVPIGEDSHAGGGSEAGLDASRTYDLTSALADIQPQRNQGWHVRLTVHADGSQGADVKHKVFWVDDCTETTAPATVQSGTTQTGAALPGDVEAGPGSEAPAAPDTVPAQVLGTDVTAAAPSNVGVAPAALMAESATSAAPSTATAPAQVLGETVTRAPAGATGPSALARTGIGLGLAVLGLVLLGVGIALHRIGALRFPHVRS